MTSPYLFPSSLKQTWNKLDHASTSSKSEAKPTLQVPKFDPHFWGSKNVTASLATPRSHLSHVSDVAQTEDCSLWKAIVCLCIDLDKRNALEEQHGGLRG
ncbi:hypothetical protein PIB30_073389, partial [Stylosanthes scabra]|nr:hypothetical protein [Stylosanthes scabra]